MTKRIENEDWSGVRFKNINFAGAKIVDGNFHDADFNGYIGSLKVNGFYVWPLIEAEMNRRYPERVKLTPTDPAGCAEAVAIVSEQLDQTWQRARALNEEQRNQSVDDEWSVVETTRHIVMVVDQWLGRNIKGENDPFHAIALPPTFMPAKLPGTSIDPDSRPSFEEAVVVCEDRLATLRRFVETVTPEELKRPIDHPHAETVLDGLHVIIDELWAHNQFANRDMAVLEKS